MNCTIEEAIGLGRTPAAPNALPLKRQIHQGTNWAPAATSALPQPVANIGLRSPDDDINQLRERCSPQALDWSSHPRLDRTSGRPQAGSAEPPDKSPGGFASQDAGFVFCRLLIRPDLVAEGLARAMLALQAALASSP